MNRRMRLLCAASGALLMLAGAVTAGAQVDEPTVYVIQKGDTLWGLSERFFKDPYYWPNLWARNPRDITNPHFIFPGQKLKVYPDRIEVVTPKGEAAEEAVVATVAAPGAAKPVEEVPVAAERTFTVAGGEGYILEDGYQPAGFIITTHQNRRIVGEDDIVYTDLGRLHGAKAGDRFSIYKKLNAVSHPVTNVILGYRVVPLGSLQLTEVEEKVSKALIIKSFQEIEPGAYLLPFKNRRKEVPLKAAERDLVGYIVESKTGNKAIAAGDVAYLDLGKRQGVGVGNLFYVVRDVQLDQQYLSGPVEKLPVDVLGAMVVVETEDNTSTALVVKSIDAIYRGDRVEMKRNR